MAGKANVYSQHKAKAEGDCDCSSQRQQIVHGDETSLGQKHLIFDHFLSICEFAELSTCYIHPNPNH